MQQEEDWSCREALECVYLIRDALTQVHILRHQHRCSHTVAQRAKGAADNLKSCCYIKAIFVNL